MKHVLHNSYVWRCVCLYLACAVGQLNANIENGAKIKFVNDGEAPVTMSAAWGSLDSELTFLTFGSAVVVVPPKSSKVVVISFDTYEGLRSASMIVTSYLDVATELVGASYIKTGPVDWQPWIETGSFPGSETGGTLTINCPTAVRPGTPDARKTIWELEDTTLTADLFREGVDKIVAFGVDNQPASGQTGTGTSGGMNVSGDSVEAHQKAGMDALGTTVETVSVEGLDPIRVPAGVLAKMMALGEAAAVAARDLVIGARGGDMPTAPSIASGSAPELSVTFPSAFGGAVFNLNPFTGERLGAVSSWFRSAMAWLTMVLLGLWIWRELDLKTSQIGQMQQAKGNTVAGTGGQLTALLAASLMTVAIVLLLTALVAFSFGEMTFTAIRSVFGTDPMGSLASGSAWMLNQLFPVATIITALLARLAWRFYSLPLYTLCLTACRFIVP